MKLYKETISLLLILLLLIGLVLPVNASDGEQGNNTPTDATQSAEVQDRLGDVDGDGDISIMDATALQSHIADLVILSEEALRRSNVDFDEQVTVLDVTRIQRFVALFPNTLYIGLDVNEAAKAKQSDDEQRAALSEQKAQEAQAKKADAEARYQRTKEALAAYRARLAEIEAQNNQKAIIEQKIKNYKRQKGVDISEFNGNVDFNKLKAQGYTFVMIRMGWGSNQYSQDDSMFETNVIKAEAAGLPWGAYLYSYALNATAVQSEVKHTLRLLKGKKPTMPIAFDIEDDSYKSTNGMPSDKTLHDICLTYLKGIEAAGYYPILYTGYGWLTGALNNKDLTGTYDIWYAQWYTKMEYNTAKVGMWQYGGEVNYLESPYISGLSGPFDKDFCFKNYPVIIPAYGFNNHTGILNKSDLASTSSLPDFELYIEDGEKLPEQYNGVMGDSFRGK